jgi:probable rRNA maturation factor
LCDSTDPEVVDLEERYQVAVAVASRFRKEVDEEWLRGVAGRVLAAEGVAAAEVSVVVADDRTVRDLNARYRGEDAPTDVLSFALNERAEDFVLPPDGILRLGEVIVSLPTARRQARASGHGVREEVAWLVVHGLLHLLGYDHQEEEEERAMRSREAALLTAPGMV